MFLLNLFIAALLVRTILATVIVYFELQHSFGPDALYYDTIGDMLAREWWGENTGIGEVDYTKSGWGMPYLLAPFYFIAGRNPLAVQFFFCVVGASTTLVLYLCSKQIFNNNRAARYAALFVAFFPGMIVWTAQLLKEGLIIFLLTSALLSALHLQKRFSTNWTAILMVSLFVLASLRFYIFFMVAAAIVGGFLLNQKTSFKGLVSRFVACVVVGFALTQFGILNATQQQTERYGSLEAVQKSRAYAATSARSGLQEAEEIDVTTTTGLVSALPIGLITLYLAPFPWQVRSLTQSLTMPEMVLWWISLPFMINGIIYAVRTRFFDCAPLLYFALMLSLSYAVYQGNLGTLYRQRAQIQVILLLFTAVGFVLRMEKTENRKMKTRLAVQKVFLSK